MSGMIKIEVPVKELQEVRFILAKLQLQIEDYIKINGLTNEAKHTKFYFDSFEQISTSLYDCFCSSSSLLLM
jgi:hypothetical protein